MMSTILLMMMITTMLATWCVVKLNAEYNADEYNAAADYDGGNDDDDDDSSNLVCSKAQCQSTSCPSSSVPPHFSEAMIPL